MLDYDDFEIGLENTFKELGLTFKTVDIKNKDFIKGFEAGIVFSREMINKGYEITGKGDGN